MDERIIRRYSECFKQQVVSDLESGRFASIEEARSHYGLGGKTTIQKWLRRYGKNHLQAKVVRVEKPDEADQIRQFRRRVAQQSADHEVAGPQLPPDHPPGRQDSLEPGV